jgi:hypothetical protein
MQPQAAPVLAIQRMVGVHDRAQHLRTGMDQTLDRLAQQLQRADARPITRTK